MFTDSFPLRVLTLLAVLTVIAVVEYFYKRKNAKKYKEYCILISIAAVFSLLGALHDQITVTISPHYYSIGKGLGETHLRAKATIVGLKSGFYAGLVFACVYLYTEKTARFWSFVSWFKFTALSALIGIFIGSLGIYFVERIWHISTLLNWDAKKFIVWSWHIGLYLGATLAVINLAFKKKYQRVN